MLEKVLQLGAGRQLESIQNRLILAYSAIITEPGRQWCKKGQNG